MSDSQFNFSECTECADFLHQFLPEAHTFHPSRPRFKVFILFSHREPYSASYMNSSCSCRLIISKQIAVVVLFAQEVAPVNAKRGLLMHLWPLTMLSGSHFHFVSKRQGNLWIRSLCLFSTTLAIITSVQW